MEMKNGLTGLCQSIATQDDIIPDNTAPMQSAKSLFYNNRYYMVTLQRALLSELYVEHGIVQTMIDQPIEDAFRGQVKLISKQLSDDEIGQLNKYIERNFVYDRLIEAFKWSRLFGGGGVIVNVEGSDPSKPFSREEIKKGTNFDLFSADRWELASTPYTMNPSISNPTGVVKGMNFNFYGEEVNPSRVIIIKGKEAPSLKRLQLQGWGMSEIERLLAPMNKILKNQNVIYELLDEAKIDVYSLQDYQTSLVAGEEESIKERVALTNMLKNYLNALVLDKEDEYHQKQISFSGLSDILKESRLDVASALKMPVTKIFGMAATGFNSGEDDLENYNSMIERDIRTPAKAYLLNLVGLCCRSLFGFEPDDLDVKFSSLRILTDTEMELQRNSLYLRGKDLFILGMMTKQEFYRYLQKNDIITQDLKVKDVDEYYSDYNEYNDKIPDLVTETEDKELAKGATQPFDTVTLRRSALIRDIT